MAADLGDEWKSAIDDKGRRYFYNRRTRESKWHIPEGCIKIVTNKETGEFRLFSPAPAPAPAPASVAHGTNGPNGPNGLSNTTPATKPLVRLHSQTEMKPASSLDPNLTIEAQQVGRVQGPEHPSAYVAT